MTRDQITQAMLMQRRRQPPPQAAAGALGSPFVPAPVPQAAPMMGTPQPRPAAPQVDMFQQGFKSAGRLGDDVLDPKSVEGWKKMYEDMFGTASQGSGAP